MHTPLERLSRLFARPSAVAHASVASLITLGLVGLLIGSGAAGTAVAVRDGITWLTEETQGQVVQYNPSTRRIERISRVGSAGDGIDAVQDNGIVALRNQRNGEIITVDMSRLRAGGVRASRANSKVLVARGMVVVLDRERNRVSRVDPITARDVGEPWIAPAGSTVVDIAADDAGTVWTIGTDGTLRGLEWDGHDAQFVEGAAEHVEFVGDDALLAAHDEGVTVFGPRAGVVAQYGTRNDGYRRSNELIGVSPASVNGPADLVPGVLTDRSAIMILDRGQLRRVATNRLGCLRPSRPAAFNDTVYVVCRGSQKVIQLTRDGGIAGPAILMPGPGDAEPVTDEGRLLFSVSGAAEGIKIDHDGASERVDRLPSREPQPTHSASTDLGTAPSLIEDRQQAREDLDATAAGEGDPAAASPTQKIPTQEPTPPATPPPTPEPTPTPPMSAPDPTQPAPPQPSEQPSEVASEEPAPAPSPEITVPEEASEPEPPAAAHPRQSPPALEPSAEPQRQSTQEPAPEPETTPEASPEPSPTPGTSSEG